MADTKDDKNQEIKKDKKIFKFELNLNTIIKIISALIILAMVVFLYNNQSFMAKNPFVVQTNTPAQNTNLHQPNAQPDTQNNYSQNTENTNQQVDEIPSQPTPAQTNIFIHQLITPQEYKEKLESGEYVHIDIRTLEEYTNERITDGLNIDFYKSDFRGRLNELDKTKKYLYHCRSGHRSSLAKYIFKELGFKQVYELDGGLNA